MGIFDGELLGRADGAVVGRIDGACVGEADGETVGGVVAVCVTVWVGVRVGFGVSGKYESSV